jgi:site-specific recombinase XerC
MSLLSSLFSIFTSSSKQEAETPTPSLAQDPQELEMQSVPLTQENDPLFALDAEVERLQSNVLSENTKKAYKSRKGCYEHFCSRYSLTPWPATDVTVSRFLSYEITVKHLTFNSVSASVVALNYWNLKAGHPSIHTPKVRELMLGIAKTIGKTGTRKDPIVKEHLITFCNQINWNSASDIRDGALMSIGFFSFLRKRNLKDLTWKDITFNHDENSPSVKIFVKRSKTDALGIGRYVVLSAHEGKPWCPMWLLERLREFFKKPSPEDPVFCVVRSNKGTVVKRPLADKSMNKRIREIMRRVGISESKLYNYTCHSLRRGGATTAAMFGVEERLIKRHGGWKSDKVQIYIEEGLEDAASVTLAMKI